MTKLSPSETPQQVPLGQVHASFKEHTKLFLALATPSNPPANENEDKSSYRVDSEGARRLQPSAESARRLARRALDSFWRTEFSDDAAKLDRYILSALWPDGDPWSPGLFPRTYPGLIQRALEGIEELARHSADDSIPTSMPPRSAPMSLTQLMKELRHTCDIRTFKKWAKQFDLQQEGNRQRWSVRLDLLPPNRGGKLA